MNRRDQPQPPRHPSRRPPPRRSRLRGLLKWSGTLACLLILLAGGLCLRWHAVWWATPNGDLGVVGGGAWFRYLEGRSPRDYAPGGVLGVRIYPYRGPYRFASSWRAYGAWPTFKSDRSFGPWFLEITVPLWMPFGVIGLPTAWLWWRDRRRVAAGCCAACGYDLTGNVSGRCPECGALSEVGMPKSEV